MSKLNKEELLNALLAADITDEEIKKAREKKKSDDKVRAERDRRIQVARKELLNRLIDYITIINPDSAKKMDFNKLEKKLKEIEAHAEGASVKIELESSKKDDVNKRKDKEDFDSLEEAYAALIKKWKPYYDYFSSF